MDENPYNAGFGAWPPFFAGRQFETKFILKTLKVIKGATGPLSRSPKSAIVLVGPRGVGKTVLLDRALNMARDLGINTAEITPSLLSGPQDELVGHIFPEGWIKSVFGDLESIGVSVLGTGFHVGKKDAERRLRSAMPAFLSKNPLLLVLDEAHRCEPESLNLLFENVQVCIRAKLPLAVVLAGTPGLESHLRKCEATYVERAKTLRINTLSREESKAALEVPSKESGRPISPDAVELLLDWSDNYPYFIQLVGTHAWDASEDRSGKDITVADAKKGLEFADKERDRFYDNRYQELRERHLADHAVQVMDILKSGKWGKKVAVVERRLMEINKDMDEYRAIKVVKELQELGYLVGSE